MDPFTDQHRRQLQGLMQDERWGAVEAFVASFMLRNFAQNSIKRSSEFDTIWYAAETEGGKRTLARFFKELEDAARSVETP